MLNLKKMIAGGITTVIVFYLFPYVFPHLDVYLPKYVWIPAFVSGVICAIVYEKLFGGK